MEKPSIVQVDHRLQQDNSSSKAPGTILKNKIEKVFRVAKGNVPYGIISGGHKISVPQFKLQELKEREKRKRKDPKKIKKKHLVSFCNIPIGIYPNAACLWMNAWMQFILFIPTLRRMFDYTPKGLDGFGHFIYTYLKDQREGREITKASTKPLFKYLSYRFPSLMQKEDLFTLLKEMRTLALGNSSFDPCQLINIEKEEGFLETSLFQQLEKHKKKHLLYPLELLLSFRVFLQKKDQCYKIPVHLFFYEQEAKMSYELLAFIEYREDIQEQKSSYITYLKLQNEWYQCKDTKVSKVETNDLRFSLSRSFLFHYKRKVKAFF